MAKEPMHGLDRKVDRKLKARRRKDSSMFFGVGMFGIVGWSVAVPTLLGIALGVWIDSHWPGRHSWTLMLLILGAAMGCWNAWYWIERERRNDGDS